MLSYEGRAVYATVTHWYNHGDSTHHRYARITRPNDANGPVPGTGDWYLSSCTNDHSTCDNDENVHFKQGSGSYVHYGGWSQAYGVAWQGVNQAGIGWGNEILEEPTGDGHNAYASPLAMWVR